MTNLIRCSPIILLLFLVKVVEEKKNKTDTWATKYFRLGRIITRTALLIVEIKGFLWISEGSTVRTQT